MKKIFNRLPLYILAGLSLQSCVKLDQEPFNDLSEQNSFLSVEDAQYWINGMYDGLRENTTPLDEFYFFQWYYCGNLDGLLQGDSRY